MSNGGCGRFVFPGHLVYFFTAPHWQAQTLAPPGGSLFGSPSIRFE
jgi:hypothetical protein